MLPSGTTETNPSTATESQLKTFKFFWNTHKWTGITLALILMVMACTGFLLLLKKKYHWIQPTTMEGASGGVEDFISSQRLFEVVLSAGNPAFRTFADIDRVDFRPHDRVFKVRSNSLHEIQVDAVTGARSPGTLHLVGSEAVIRAAVAQRIRRTSGLSDALALS